MNITQTKKTIGILTKKWGIEKKRFFVKIVNFLDKNTDKKLSFHNGFEFSLINNEPKIRLLHLNFWQPGLSVGTVKNIIKKREGVIISIFKEFRREFVCNYNLNSCNYLFKFNWQNGLWPIQFGLEYQKNSVPKTKIYLSLNADSFPVSKFCNDFNLNYKALKKEFKNKKFDSIAIDFLPSGEYFLKFYPILKENKGLLYRVNQDSKILSLKTWKRFPNGLTVNGVEKSNFMKLPVLIKNIIMKNNLKIYYLCQEKDKRSLYFR